MITIDDSQFPVLLVHSAALAPGDAVRGVEKIAEYARKARSLKTKVALIVFEGDTVDARSRKDMANKVRECPEIEECVELSVIIVNSAVKRGALTALLWLVGGRPPTKPVSSPTEALAKIRGSSVVPPASCTVEYLVAFAGRQ